MKRGSSSMILDMTPKLMRRSSSMRRLMWRHMQFFSMIGSAAQLRRVASASSRGTTWAMCPSALTGLLVGEVPWSSGRIRAAEMHGAPYPCVAYAETALTCPK